MASPRPVPFPISLVVKNGSKMREMFSGEIPLPVSLTERQTKGPGETRGCPARARGIDLDGIERYGQFSASGHGVACIHRGFMMICSIIPASATWTAGREEAKRVSKEMSAPRTRRSSLITLSMTSPRSRSLACFNSRRLKVRSCRVSFAALSAAGHDILDAALNRRAEFWEMTRASCAFGSRPACC